MITVQTPRAPIKIFATGTGKFFFLQKRLFAALGFSERSELGETLVDMCRYALARRRIGRHWLLDLQLLVRDILPVLLEMFDDSPEINSAREVHKLLSKGLNQIMNQPVAPFKKFKPSEKSEQLEYLPKIGLCVLNNVPINVYKNDAGEIFLQCNHLLQALGLSRTKSLTSGDFGRFLTEHDLPHKMMTDGVENFGKRPVIVLKAADVRDLLLPNILSGAIKFNTADSKRRNARIILDDLKNYLEGKIMPPENVKPEVAETKSDTTPTEKEIPTAAGEEEKLDDTRALIDELAAVTGVPKDFIAKSLYDYKVAELERWRDRLIHDTHD